MFEPRTVRDARTLVSSVERQLVQVTRAQVPSDVPHNLSWGKNAPHKSKAAAIYAGKKALVQAQAWLKDLEDAATPKVVVAPVVQAQTQVVTEPVVVQRRLSPKEKRQQALVDKVARIEAELAAATDPQQCSFLKLRLQEAKTNAGMLQGRHPGMHKIGEAVVMTADGKKGHAFRASQRAGGVAASK